MKQWNFYTSKELKPQGWLKRQLEIQAESLSGNLHKVWRDVRDSAWIGGNAEGWERVPYWLDGFIPLAYLLEREDLIADAKIYIDSILAAQQNDGWICPCSTEERTDYDTWAVQLISKVLTVYYECSADERILSVLYRTLKNYHQLLSDGSIKLFNWGKYRWFECCIAIDLLYQHCKEDWLLDLTRILREQGTDYSQLTPLWKRPVNKWTYDTHIVNLAMMLKSECVSCDLLHEDYKNLAETLHSILDTYNGTPVGLFTGDECLSGLSPVQGTELCAVVEQMYSYELLYAYTGEHKWAERLEVLAFNALPATLSDDMWAHQYVQQSNQISCEKFPGKSFFRTNGPEAHLFGLEPNYGCCTANFNQGWPKLALSVFLHKDGEILSALPLPSSLNCEKASITLNSCYPFENSLHYHIDAKQDFTLHIRIPSFAEQLQVNSEPVATSDLFFRFAAGECRDIDISFSCRPQLHSRPHGLYSVCCGSLYFSLPIAYEKRILEYTKNDVERKFPYCDYEYIGKSPWNYGFCGTDFELEKRDLSKIPFSSEQPPVVLKAKLAPVEWELADGYESVCAKTPVSNAPIGDPQEILLHPYGCAKLRMTELPLSE